MKPWVGGGALLGYLWLLAHTPEFLRVPLTVVCVVAAAWGFVWHGGGSSSEDAKAPAATSVPSPRGSKRASFAFLGGGPSLRQQIAVHEAAHFVATKSAGFRSRGAEYHGDGGRSHIAYPWWGGRGSTDDVIATLAGVAMEIEWLQREHGFSYRKAKATAEPHAQADFQSLSRDALKRGSDGYLRIDPYYVSKAERFVRRNYDQILRNAEVMVRRGQISELVD